MKRISILPFIPIALTLIHVSANGDVWTRHTIDDSSRGADGVRLGDVNHDGLLDIVTPWEEGGTVRITFHPGVERVEEPWPSVTVGNVGSPEDAVFVDVNGDGQLDVVTSCEGKTRGVYVHWAPSNRADLIRPDAWKTEEFPGLKNKMQFMFALPMDVNQDGREDIVLGGKNAGAELGWMEAPENPTDLGTWNWRTLRPLGWVMSIQKDLTFPGTPSLFVSDRKGQDRGVYRLTATEIEWRRGTIGGADNEVMFIDARHKKAIAWATKDDGVFVKFAGRQSEEIHLPLDEISGSGKGIAVGDINGDRLLDVVVTCENAENKLGVFAFLQPLNRREEASRWTRVDIGGMTGTKFDRIELIDLDQDGDLDVLTCEEREGLGVIWYENSHE
jgi:hypothetical protein